MMNVRSLGEMVNEIICDNILRKFEGNKCIPLENLRMKEFYENIDPDYSVVEDHVYFLIRDHTLRETGATLSLTTKGWFMLTNAEKVGYVAKRIEIARQLNNEKDNRTFFTWATVLAASLILGVFVVKLMNN
jgi:hypothetical protein